MYSKFLKYKILGGIALSPILFVIKYLPLKKEDDWKTLKDDPNFLKDDSVYHKDTFGKKNSKYLLSPEKGNYTAWQALFILLKHDIISQQQTNNSPFNPKENTKSITNPWGETENSLNKVCERAYKTNSSEILSTSTDESKFTSNLVWKYCSLIELLNGETQKKYEDNTIGKEVGLVDVDDEGNMEFWQSLTEDFYANDSDRAGSKAQESSLFKTFYENNKATKKSIKEACAQAYKKQNTDASTKNDAKKFCAVY